MTPCICSTSPRDLGRPQRKATRQPINADSKKGSALTTHPVWRSRPNLERIGKEVCRVVSFLDSRKLADVVAPVRGNRVGADGAIGVACVARSTAYKSSEEVQ